MAARSDILRGIKLAGYAFAGLLACMAAYNVINPTPAGAPAPDPSADSATPFGATPSTSPTVPPPPPLPAQAKSSGAPRRVAASKPPSVNRDAVQIREVAAAEDPLPARIESVTPAMPEAREAPATALSSGDTGIVIVRPPERPSRENRGLRWVKAVGRALHIGAEKNE